MFSKATKPAVLVMLHHTFDTECVVPESSKAVNRANTITVDCLFHEDQGLLRCKKNYDAIKHIEMQIEPQVFILINLDSNFEFLFSLNLLKYRKNIKKIKEKIAIRIE